MIILNSLKVILGIIGYGAMAFYYIKKIIKEGKAGN